MSIQDEFGALFEEETYDGPTTAQMDGILTEQDERDRYKAYIQCRRCNGWTLVDGDAEMHTTIAGYSKNQVCEHCGAHDFDPTSTTSKRTWNPQTAKRRKPRVKK